MSAERYRIKRGTLRPALRATITQGDRTTAIDLTGTTVKFRMRSRRTSAVKVNLAAAVIVDAANGIVEYQWAGTDTDTVGVYDAEFQVVYPGGATLLAPAIEAGEDGCLEVEVTADLT